MFPDYNAYSQYYGLNTGFNGGFTPGFDFRGNVSMNNEEIITFNQAVEMIKKSVLDEREDELFYESLIKEAPTEKEKNIIASIKDDERRHNRILRELYFNFTGQVIPVDTANENNQTEGMSYKEKLEKSLFGELDAVVKYRRIMGVMPSGNSYTLIISIMTDELRHASKYNFLIHNAK